MMDKTGERPRRSGHRHRHRHKISPKELPLDPPVLVYLYDLCLRLQNVNETSEFFSHALDMWCCLFFLSKCGGTNWAWESDLGDLLKCLANFAYHRKKCQSVSDRKIFIDTPSGTSIWLPNLGQYCMSGSKNCWSKFMWKVGEIIDVFKTNFTLSIHHDGPCQIASLQTQEMGSGYTLTALWRIAFMKISMSTGLQALIL